MDPKRILTEDDLGFLSDDSTQSLIEEIIRARIDAIFEEGLDDAWNLSASTIEREAAEAVPSHHFVAADENGRIIRAGYENPGVIGFIKTAVGPGEKVPVYVSGVFSNPSWDFRRGSPLVLGQFGEPIHLPVQSVLVFVGMPVDTHTFVMRIDTPITLL
jgi:hypothetical protein